MPIVVPPWFKELPDQEQRRLLHDATKPLTPDECERKLEGTGMAHLTKQVRDAAGEIAQARVRFCQDCIASLVQKKEVPSWVLEGGDKGTDLLQREGYHFEVRHDDPLWMGFKKGITMVAEMKISLRA